MRTSSAPNPYAPLGSGEREAPIHVSFNPPSVLLRRDRAASRAADPERLLDQRQLASFDYRLELGGDAKLAAETAGMCGHGGVADPEPPSDVAAGDSLRHEAKDLLLAGGEAFQLRIHRSALVQKGGDGPGRDQRVPPGNHADRIHNLRGRARFVDETARA